MLSVRLKRWAWLGSAGALASVTGCLGSIERAVDLVLAPAAAANANIIPSSALRPLVQAFVSFWNL